MRLVAGLAALAALERAVELDPGLAYPHTGLAGIYRRMGDEAQSQRHLAEARRLTKPDDHRGLACLESIAGDVNAGLIHLEQALEEVPGWRDWARCASSLDFIRDDARFRELVGER